MRKEYHIPTIEVVRIATGPLMGVANVSDGGHAEMAPQRRDAVF